MSSLSINNQTPIQPILSIKNIATSAIAIFTAHRIALSILGIGVVVVVFILYQRSLSNRVVHIEPEISDDTVTSIVIPSKIPTPREEGVQEDPTTPIGEIEQESEEGEQIAIEEIIVEVQLPSTSPIGEIEQISEHEKEIAAQLQREEESLQMLTQLCNPLSRKESVEELMKEVKRMKGEICRKGSKIFLKKGSDIWGVRLRWSPFSKQGGFNYINAFQQIIGDINQNEWVLKKSKLNDSENIEHEVRILKFLNKRGKHLGIPECPLIVKESDEILAIMKKFKCTLFEITSTNKYKETLTPKKKKEICIGILEALVLCEVLGIRKGDMKPSNVMLDEENRPFLIDFDGSIKVDDLTITDIINDKDGRLLGPYDPRFVTDDDIGTEFDLRNAIKSVFLYKEKKDSLLQLTNKNLLHMKVLTRVLPDTDEKSIYVKSELEKRYQPRGKKDSTRALLDFIFLQFPRRVKKLLKNLGISKSGLFENPEQVERKLLEEYQSHLKKIDVFSTGITLAKFLFGDLTNEWYTGHYDMYDPTPRKFFPFKPFSSTNEQIVRSEYCGFTFDSGMKLDDFLDKDRFNRIPAGLQGAIKKMLTLDPQERPTLRKSLELLKSLDVNQFATGKLT